MGDLIKRTKYPNTVESMTSELRALGIEEGDVAIVHSSMSAIGWVCIDASSVVRALINAFSDEGTIVMPAHTPSNSDPADWENPPVPKEWHETIRQSIPAFNKDTSPSEAMGAIAECFRTYPGTQRSDHPHVSFTARGKLARQICQNHILTPYFGMETPLGELYRLNAKVLLLGVDYSKCTIFHLAEALSGKRKMISNGCSMYTQFEPKWVSFKDYDYDSDNFQDLGQAFQKAEPVNIGKIGNANCLLFHAKPAVDFAVRWFRG